LSPAPTTNTHRFTGHERDAETGRDYLLARYYGIGIARFYSVDPLASSATLARPDTWNRYAYTLNNPVKHIDPTGEETYLVIYGRPYTANNLSPRDAGDLGTLLRRAADTRAREIRARGAFNPSRDAVIVKEVGTKQQFKDTVNARYDSGAIQSLDVFSHGFMWQDSSGTGLNFGEGPKGSDVKRFSTDEAGSLSPEMAKGASVTLYGCVVGALGEKSLAQALADKLQVAVTASTGPTHFDNTNPTPENPDVHQVPQGGRMKKFYPQPIQNAPEK
jgi:RHS repeat-associated protein